MFANLASHRLAEIEVGEHYLILFERIAHLRVSEPTLEPLEIASLANLLALQANLPVQKLPKQKKLICCSFVNKLL